MKNLKLYASGALALALVLGAASVSNAQSTIMAVGSAGGPQTIVYSHALTASKVNLGNGFIEVLIAPGSMIINGVPSTAVQTTALQTNLQTNSNISLPGVPNTGSTAVVGGGPIIYSTGTNMNTGTMSINSNVGIPGWNSGTYSWNNNPGSFMTANGTVLPIDANGMIHIRGMVSTIAPEAMGFVSGNQSWSVRWANSGTNSGTAMTNFFTVGGQNSLAGLQAGDIVEVDGYINSRFSSQIDAVNIREI